MRRIPAYSRRTPRINLTMKLTTKHVLRGLPLALGAAFVAAPAAENRENYCAKCHGADGKARPRLAGSSR